MFVISQDSCNVMHEIDGAYVRVSVVGCVSHTLCPLTEQFKLFVCHGVIHHVLEFFHVFPIAQDSQRYVVVVTSQGVLPSFGLTCIGFLDVFEAVNKFFVHVLEF